MSTTPTTFKPSALALTALTIAAAQRGQREVPRNSNRGPMVDKYLAAVGLNPGFAWCMAFVYWCYQTAATGLHCANPLPRTGGVLACWNSIQPAKRITKAQAIANPSLIGPGAIGIMDFGGGKGHAFIVASASGVALDTIEGNSNADGSREGDGVVTNKRKITDALIKGFINY